MVKINYKLLAFLSPALAFPFPPSASALLPFPMRCQDGVMLNKRNESESRLLCGANGLMFHGLYVLMAASTRASRRFACPCRLVRTISRTSRKQMMSVLRPWRAQHLVLLAIADTLPMVPDCRWCLLQRCDSCTRSNCVVTVLSLFPHGTA